MKKLSLLFLAAAFFVVPGSARAGLSESCFPGVECDAGDDYYNNLCQSHIESVSGATPSCVSVNGAAPSGKQWAFDCDKGCYLKNISLAPTCSTAGVNTGTSLPCCVDGQIAVRDSSAASGWKCADQAIGSGSSTTTIQNDNVVVDGDTTIQGDTVIEGDNVTIGGDNITIEGDNVTINNIIKGDDICLGGTCYNSWTTMVNNEVSIPPPSNLWSQSGGNVYRSSGNVGIGATANSDRLFVSGSALFKGGAGVIKLAETDNSNVWWFVADGNSFSIRKNNESGYPFSIQDDKDVVFTGKDVGIGTTSPSDKLHVNGSIRATSSVYVTNPANTSASAALNFYNNVARIRIGGNGAGAGNGLDIQGPGDSSMMIITSSGIGIGDTSPNATLHVSAPSAPQDGYAFRVQIDGNTRLSTWANGGTAIGSNTEPPSNGLYVGGLVDVADDVTAYNLNLSGSSPDIRWFGGYSGAPAKDLRFRSTHGALSDVTRMSIEGDTGEVGIGTASPSYLLDVRGTVRSTEGFLSTGDLGLELDEYVDDDVVFHTHAPTQGILSDYTDSGYGYAINIHSDGSGSAYTVGDFRIVEHCDNCQAGYDERTNLIVKNNHVGINTTSPYYMLDVNGTIRGEDIRADDSVIANRFTDSNNFDYYMDLSSSSTSIKARGQIYGGSIKIKETDGAQSRSLCRTSYDSSGYEIRICSSLRSMKQDIEDLDLGLDEVLKMRPVSFYWKGATEGEHVRDIGFIAEEVADVNPLIAEYDGENLTSVKYNTYTAVLTKAIQEQQAIIKSLEERIAVLESNK